MKNKQLPYSTIFTLLLNSALVIAGFIFFSACSSTPSVNLTKPGETSTGELETPVNPLPYRHTEFSSIADTLLRRGMDTMFLMQLLNDDRLNFEQNLIKINVTGTRKKPDYSSHYNKLSVKKAQEFLEKNRAILQEAEQKYDVPKEAITAILWIETKFGTYLGKNYIPSIFFSVALAATPENIARNKEAMYLEYTPSDSIQVRELETKIELRAKKKSLWAIGELLALDTLRRISPLSPFELYGSSAGAFGMSQFLPSSYIRWSADGNGDGIKNLFEIPDAIHSVANYLKINGWGNTRAAQEKAVFHYNNSKDYVDAVLRLAEKLGEKQ
ncbi:MAG: lytic murein transglycosylase [Ignavibacteriae bacterium]|nr:lytic murein transglycosylase [Ignavibacteriota bacterium]